MLSIVVAASVPPVVAVATAPAPEATAACPTNLDPEIVDLVNATETRRRASKRRRIASQEDIRDGGIAGDEDAGSSQEAATRPVVVMVTVLGSKRKPEAYIVRRSEDKVS
jgi:hypothetical protein